MKLFAAASVLIALLVLASGAHAEDYDWAGAYVGVGIAGVTLNTGAAGTNTDNTSLDAADTASTDPQLDLSAGYNLLLKKKLLLGIEADLQVMLPQDGETK